MKISINKKNIKNLSKSAKEFPLDLTPQLAGGNTRGGTVYCGSNECPTSPVRCN